MHSPECDARWQWETAARYASGADTWAPFDEWEVGAILPNITTSESVRALKDEIDPFARALDAEVDACATYPADRRAAWKAFYGSWRTYADGPDSGFLGVGAGPLFAAGLAFQEQLKGWKADIDGRCGGGTTPPIVPHDEPHKSDTEAIGGMVSTIAIGAGVVVAGLIVLELVKRR